MSVLDTKITMASPRKQHQTFTSEQIKKKRHEATPDSTLKCNRKWNKVFRDYLEEKDFESTEYWCYPEDELDRILSTCTVIIFLCKKSSTILCYRSILRINGNKCISPFLNLFMRTRTLCIRHKRYIFLQANL